MYSKTEVKNQFDRIAHEFNEFNKRMPLVNADGFNVCGIHDEHQILVRTSNQLENKLQMLTKSLQILDRYLVQEEISDVKRRNLIVDISLFENLVNDMSDFVVNTMTDENCKREYLKCEDHIRCELEKIKLEITSLLTEKEGTNQKHKCLRLLQAIRKLDVNVETKFVTILIKLGEITELEYWFIVNIYGNVDHIEEEKSQIGEKCQKIDKLIGWLKNKLIFGELHKSVYDFIISDVVTKRNLNLRHLQNLIDVQFILDSYLLENEGDFLDQYE